MLLLFNGIFQLSQFFHDCLLRKIQINNRCIYFLLLIWEKKVAQLSSFGRIKIIQVLCVPQEHLDPQAYGSSKLYFICQ